MRPKVELVDPWAIDEPKETLSCHAVRGWFIIIIMSLREGVRFILFLTYKINYYFFVYSSHYIYIGIQYLDS